MKQPFLQTHRLAERTRIKGVYVIECLVNGRTYIGSSVDVFLRWNEHFEGMTQRLNLEKRAKTNRWLALDCEKYGIKNFVFRIHPKSNSALTFEELQALESEIIKSEQPYYNVLGK